MENRAITAVATRRCDSAGYSVARRACGVCYVFSRSTNKEATPVILRSAPMVPRVTKCCTGQSKYNESAPETVGRTVGWAFRNSAAIRVRNRDRFHGGKIRDSCAQNGCPDNTQQGYVVVATKLLSPEGLK